jgi:hypothetical protein
VQETQGLRAIRGKGGLGHRKSATVQVHCLRESLLGQAQVGQGAQGLRDPGIVGAEALRALLRP